MTDNKEHLRNNLEFEPRWTALLRTQNYDRKHSLKRSAISRAHEAGRHVVDADKILMLDGDSVDDQVLVGYYGYAAHRTAEWSPYWDNGVRQPFWAVGNFPHRGGRTHGVSGKHMQNEDHDWTEEEVIVFLTTGQLPF